MQESKKSESPHQLIEQRMEAWYGEYWTEEVVLSMYRITYFAFMESEVVPEDVRHSLTVMYNLVEGLYPDQD